MKQLYPHQQKFAKGYSGKNLIVHEGGTGKTICACVWLKDGRDADALVICPKRVVFKWQEALKEWGTKALVVSKETFKKMEPRQYSAIIVDEADEFASPLFMKGRSQLSTALYNLIKTYDAPRLLLTATPVRSSPANLHTLLCLAGHYIEWKKWRDHFYSLEKRPYLPRAAYLPVKDWRKKTRTVLEKYADIVLLKDCVDFLPSVTEEIIKIDTPPFVQSAWDDAASFHEEMRWEQQNKLSKIKEIGKEYRKVFIIIYHVLELDKLYKELSKERETFMIKGGIKNQEEIIKNAEESDECYFLVQASLGSGWETPSFSCMIFSSMSYSVRDYIQMKFRCRRMGSLHPIKIFFLQGGRCDRAIFEQIQKGRSFIPSEWKS